MRVDIEKRLGEEIVGACAYLAIPQQRAELLARMILERFGATLRTPADLEDARRERDARIRAEYVGRPGQAKEIARREGVSVRLVRRIANGR